MSSMDYSEEMPPLPVEQMPPEWGPEAMPPEWMPPAPTSRLSAPVEMMPPEPLPNHFYRILAAVDPKISPSFLDWGSINDSIRQYHLTVELQSDKPRRDEIRRLNRIIRTAKQLADMLNEPENELKDLDDEDQRGFLKDCVRSKRVEDFRPRVRN